MPTSPVDTLEMRDASALMAPAAADESIEDVLFPPLPPGLDPENKRVKEITERDLKTKFRATALLVLRMQGYSRREIGQLMGMTPNCVRVSLNRARQKGHLGDLRAILENDSAALAVESLNFHLKKKDKDVTVETLKGLGHFRTYNHSKMEGVAGASMPALSVTIVNAPNADGGQQAIVSTPVGMPREDAAG